MNENIVDRNELCKLIEKCDNYNKIEHAFNQLGINLIENNIYRPVLDVFEDLARKWSKL